MSSTRRLNIGSAVESFKRSASFGVSRMPNDFDDNDLDLLLKEIGRLLIPGFILDEWNSKVYREIRLWADGQSFSCINPLTRKKTAGDPRKGIYLCGPTGSGKSMLLRIINEYIKTLHLKVKIGDREEPLSWTTYRASEICNSFGLSGDLSPYYNATVLCIDDIGSEPSETLYMGNRVNVIRTILEYRGDYQNKITLLTSNIRLSPDIKGNVINDIYGDRVQSRLFGMCNYFELTGADRRIY